MEEKIDVRIRGIAPLLQNKFNIDNGNGKTKKSGMQYDHEKEVEQALYKDKEGNIVQPAIHIKSAMVKSLTQITI